MLGLGLGLVRNSLRVNIRASFRFISVEEFEGVATDVRSSRLRLGLGVFNCNLK